MIEQSDDGSMGVPFEIRAMGQAVQRLREVLYGQRCVVCMDAITADSPAAMLVGGLAVCRKPGCAAVVLDVDVGEITGEGE